ncbi:MAG: transketolase C-terminal domain-containing protein [Phycisphaeraceae bacterium]|nr:transketolase C-terminal domain-containing protein [Phycisphaeraceae bacterium]
MPATTQFPIDLGAFEKVALDPTQPLLSETHRQQLRANIDLARDTIIFFTAVADAKGLGGHTGGPFDIVPEVMIADAFMRGTDKVVPIFFDEAGHRVAIQYLMSVLNGDMDAERLMHYREFDSKLPGHPERNFTPGVKISSGRLGHMWPYVNGVAMANPDKVVFCFGSDGSQMEGNDAEAARLAVAQNLNVKLLIDDNDVTIAGYPSKYLPGFDVAQTLAGHGLQVDIGEGEDLDALYERMAGALHSQGPVALINKRKMAPGVPGIEGSNHGHDVIKVDAAIKYFQQRNKPELIEALEAVEKPSKSFSFAGSNDAKGKNRDAFGKIVCEILDGMKPEERAAKVRAIDSDLEGSCGMHHIRKNHPEVYVSSGVMERGNFSAAAGFGYDEDKQGIFATFSAFMEMVISEITMARLNESNVLCHFSHAGCDDMADNTCHFGVNNFFADNGFGKHDRTDVYFPADQHQFKAVLEKIFWDKGLRFIFSTRSAVPDILNENGDLFYGDGYEFNKGADEVIREGSAGYVVSYGEMLYRALDAVERAREEGLDVGLINKPHLNSVDEQTLTKIGKSKFVLIAESQNRKTGLGSRLGSQLLQRGLHPRYDHLGVEKIGNGGLWEHMPHQGLDPDSILAKIKDLAG